MDSHETGYLKLDQEFDRYLAEMKPHVLKLPHKTGKNSKKVLHVAYKGPFGIIGGMLSHSKSTHA